MKRLQKESNWKVTLRAFFEAILILGSVPSSIKPIVWCIPPDVWPMFGRYKFPRTLLQQWSVHKSLMVDYSCNHISYFIHLDFCETSSKGDFLYTLLWSTPRHPWFDYSTGTEYSKPWPWWLLRCRTPNQKFSAWKMYGNSTGSILEQGLLHVDMIYYAYLMGILCLL